MWWAAAAAAATTSSRQRLRVRAMKDEVRDAAVVVQASHGPEWLGG
jgi:hypothetical protein